MELINAHGSEQVPEDATQRQAMAMWKDMTGMDGIHYKNARELIFYYGLDASEVLEMTNDAAMDFMELAEKELATGAITKDTGECFNTARIPSGALRHILA